MQKTLLLSFVLTILAVIFAIQNSAPVTLKLYFWLVDLPLALVIIFSMTIGAVLGILFSIPKRKKKEITELNKPEEKQKNNAGNLKETGMF